MTTVSPVAKPWSATVAMTIGVVSVAPTRESHWGTATFWVVAALCRAALARRLKRMGGETTAIPDPRSTPQTPKKSPQGFKPPMAGLHKCQSDANSTAILYGDSGSFE